MTYFGSNLKRREKLRHQDHSGRAISLGLLALVILLIGSANGAVIVVPNEYTTIQAAINAANAGVDTIQVNNGTYDEEVVVNKSLILVGSGLPIITSSTGDAITFKADNCEFRHFIVRGALGAGIYVDNSDGHTIENNTIEDNGDEGIVLDGYDFGSDGHTIQNNIVRGNGYDGIALDTSNDNEVLDNTITGNRDSGIYLVEGVNNEIRDNFLNDNEYNGITIEDSQKNEVANNTATGNTVSGIYLASSSGNTIYLNTFNNPNNARSPSPNSNHWNSTTSLTREYDGRNVTGLLGNIWFDYDGFDCDGDGIGDTPYDKIIDGSERDSFVIG